MDNVIKYDTTAGFPSGHKGFKISNLAGQGWLIGVNDVEYGPTSTTGYWEGIEPPIGQYTVYEYKASQGPSIHVCPNDSNLIWYTNYLGHSASTIEDALSFFWNSPETYLVSNRNLENFIISTSAGGELYLHTDFGYSACYPRTGSSTRAMSEMSNGTIFGSGYSWTSDGGGSINFNGSSSYLEVPASFSGYSNWAYSIWVKLSSTSVTSNIGGPFPYASIFHDPTSGWGVRNNAGALYTSGLIGPINTWVNLVMSCSGSTISLYKDGVLLIPSIPMTSTASSVFKTVGKGLAGGALYGKAAICSLYNTPLSAQEILDLYNNLWPRFAITPYIVAPGYVLYYDMGNPSSYSGVGSLINDLEVNNDTTTLYNTPTYNPAETGFLTFNGTTQYGIINPVNIAYFDLSGQNFTIEGWFRPYSVSSLFAIISKDYYGFTFDWALIVNDPSTIRLYSQATGALLDFSVPDRPLSTKVWYHLALRGNLSSGVSSVTCFLNGVTCGTGNILISESGLPYTALSLACTGANNPGNFLNGDLAEVRVYQTGLTNIQIAENYQAGRDRRGISRKNLLCWLKASDSTSYPGTGTTWYDLSGNGNNATLHNITYSAPGMVFNGSTSYADIPAMAIGQQEATIVFWVNTTDMHGGDNAHRIMGLEDTDDPSNGLSIYNATLYTPGDSYNMSVRNSGAVGNPTFHGPGYYGVVSTGTWYMYAVSINNGEFYFTVNGTNTYTYSMPGGTYTLTPGIKMHLGSSGTGTFSFDGLIGEFLYYDHNIDKWGINWIWELTKGTYGY